MPGTTPADDQAPAPLCTSCHKPLRDTEHRADGTPYQGCTPCRRRVDADLAALAGEPTYEHGHIISGLYAALGDILAPSGGGDGGRVSGSHTAPLPIRLEPLSLAAHGGVLTILQTWQIDWHDRLGKLHPRWQGGLQQQLDDTALQLRRNLLWAAADHPAWAEFAHEMRKITTACRTQVTGERTERRITVVCTTIGCGGLMRLTVSTSGARCATCGTRYGRTEALRLPIAQRTAA